LKQGVYRTELAGMAGENSLDYQPAEPARIAGLMSRLFAEIGDLLGRELKVGEVFYYAAFMHLRLAHILPFTDGNGRAARLLEKWFLARKLGIQYWNLQVEKQYKDHQQEYYDHLKLGPNFEELDYSKAVPFLQMLPNSF
ncbi:MAG: Fic family protein, partial [Desulfobaccales bacterium]